MAVTPEWTIEQLGGDRKKISLTARFAPHGRPRQKPVITKRTSTRQIVVRYSGTNVPTRHILGDLYEDRELTGRFADWYPGGGPGVARARATELHQFKADAQPVRVTWGSVLSFTGLVDVVETAYESVAEVAWKIVFNVDSDDDVKQTLSGAQPVSPASVQPQAIVQELLGPLAVLQSFSTLPNISADFLDSIADVVDALNAPAASLLAIADQVQTLEGALSVDLRRLSGAITGLNTAVARMRESVDLFSDEQAMNFQNSQTAISYGATRMAMDRACDLIALLLADLFNSTELALRGKSQTSYVAQAGDLWESISVSFYGDPSGAQKIRDANGVRYGAQPVAGKSYHIPTSG